MKRHILFNGSILLTLTLGFLQNIHSQITVCKSPEIKLTFPNSKWKLSDSVKTENATIYSYFNSGQSFPRPKTDPFLIITVENRKINKTSAAYAEEASRLLPYSILEKHTNKSTQIPIPNVPDAITYKFSGPNYEIDRFMKGFSTYVVEQGRGISFLLAVNQDMFESAEKDFLSIIKSIECKNCGSRVSQNESIRLINPCDYMPLKNRMSYTYSSESSELPVKQTLKTVYTFTKNKTVNGAVFKGYRVTSDDPMKKGNIYYNCSGNAVKAHAELVEVDIFNQEMNNTGNFFTFTEIKGNLKVGDSWEEVQLFDGKEQDVTTTLDDIGLELTVNGKVYKDVIKIVKLITQGTLLGNARSIQEFYYAKGIGLIKFIYLFQGMASKSKVDELVSYSLQ